MFTLGFPKVVLVFNAYSHTLVCSCARTLYTLNLLDRFMQQEKFCATVNRRDQSCSF